MTNRSEAENELQLARRIIAERSGWDSPQDAVPQFLNLLVIVGIGATRALLDVADAIRETRQENTP